MTHVVINGAAGRMGRTLMEACIQYPGLTLAGAIERPGSDVIGRDAGLLIGPESLGISVSDSLESITGKYDVVVDFTRPESTLNLLKICGQLQKSMVIGTTGFTDAQTSEIQALADKAGVVFAPNMSVGVNLCFKLLDIAAKALGDDVDIEIIEAHHRDKVDAPSGTALRMGEVVADALGRDLAKDAVYGREGITGERDRKTIGFETIRAGDIVGEHTVMFAGEGERIEITHKATSRMNFAKGAMRAAAWLSNQPPGLYDMQDVLGLK